MSTGAPIESSAAALRRAFDGAFAEPPPAEAEATEDLLAIRAGGDPFALRLGEVASLHVDHPVAPAPAGMPEFLGIAEFRGMLAPIFDLRLLMGYAAEATPRWIVLLRGASPVGLAFDVFERQCRVPRRLVSTVGTGSRVWCEGAVLLDGVPRPIIHAGSIVEEISRRVHPGAPAKER